MTEVSKEAASQGCLLRFLPDGRAYEIDLHDADDYSEDICAEGARIAYHWGRATHPVSDYDLEQARVKITGEVREIAKLRTSLATTRTELAAKDAEIARLRAIVRKYGDRQRMATAPAELQQSIDDAFIYTGDPA